MVMIINMTLEVLANAKKKEINDIQIGKKEIILSLFKGDMIIYVENILKWTKSSWN